MNPAKRQKSEQFPLDSLLCAKFTKKSPWLVLYFAVILDCDTPILEALLYSTYAYTAAKPQASGLQSSDYAFVLTLVRSLQDYLCSLRPPLSVVANALITTVKFSNAKWIQFETPLLTSNFPYHTLKVVSESNGNRNLLFVLFISYESSRLFDVALQPIRYGSFSLVVEQVQNDLKTFLEL
jgi:hypothetical protein